MSKFLIVIIIDWINHLNEILVAVKLWDENILSVGDAREGDEETATTDLVGVIWQEALQAFLQVLADVKAGVEGAQGSRSRLQRYVQYVVCGFTWKSKLEIF